MPDQLESRSDPLKVPDAGTDASLPRDGEADALPSDRPGASPPPSEDVTPKARRREDGNEDEESDEDDDENLDAGEAGVWDEQQWAEARAKTRRRRLVFWLVVCPVLLLVFRVPIQRLGYELQARFERAFPEELSAERKAEIARLKATRDPVAEEIRKWHNQLHNALHARRFEDLEKEAALAREGQAKFANGAWKVVEFYKGLECNHKEEARWLEHDKLHLEWMIAVPKSVTAQIAQAHFLADYAWHARGSGYANTITAEGRRLFEERLEQGRKVLEPVRAAGPVADLAYYTVALRIALGQKKPNQEREAMYRESQAGAPGFWPAQIARAYSLLPRWYGSTGDWEAFAEEAAAQPGGLGDEAYARIVVDLSYFYADGGVFNLTDASWPRTRDGLALMRQRYPNAPEFLSKTALLAGIARDQAVAREMFEALGETYHAEVWKHPAYYLRVRDWARTGKW